MSATRRRVMFLVDFDNVSTEVIEQALSMVYTEYGAVHVRRAYCTAEHAVANAAFMKRLSLRPMVNLAVGKNSTDIALAVDAMDLALAERPDVAVIVSSDSDFTPLVGRLREKGAWVRGFGQRGKTGEGVMMAYDEFHDLAHREAKVAAVAAPKPVAARKAPVKRAPARKQAAPPPPPPAPTHAPEIEAILQAVPGLRGGDKVELGEAARALRDAGLLARTAPSTKLFKTHADSFALSPERQPNRVQFTVTLKPL